MCASRRSQWRPWKINGNKVSWFYHRHILPCTGWKLISEAKKNQENFTKFISIISVPRLVSISTNAIFFPRQVILCEHTPHNFPRSKRLLPPIPSKMFVQATHSHKFRSKIILLTPKSVIQTYTAEVRGDLQLTRTHHTHTHTHHTHTHTHTSMTCLADESSMWKPFPILTYFLHAHNQNPSILLNTVWIRKNFGGKKISRVQFCWAKFFSY